MAVLVSLLPLELQSSSYLFKCDCCFLAIICLSPFPHHHSPSPKLHVSSDVVICGKLMILLFLSLNSVPPSHANFIAMLYSHKVLCARQSLADRIGYSDQENREGSKEEAIALACGFFFSLKLIQVQSRCESHLCAPLFTLVSLSSQSANGK